MFFYRHETRRYSKAWETCYDIVGLKVELLLFALQSLPQRFRCITENSFFPAPYPHRRCVEAGVRRLFRRRPSPRLINDVNSEGGGRGFSSPLSLSLPSSYTSIYLSHSLSLSFSLSFSPSIRPAITLTVFPPRVTLWLHRITLTRISTMHAQHLLRYFGRRH